MPLLSEQNRRKRNLLIILCFLVLVGGLSAFDLGSFAPELPVASNIVIFALFNLNLMVFLLLLILLFRNLVKLGFERRQKVIGARFKAKLVHVKDPILGDLATRELSEVQLKRGLAGQEVTTVRELTSGDLIEAVTPIWAARGGERHVIGAVVVGTHVTERLEAKVRGISQAFREYKQLKLLKNPIKGIYILLFLLMTLIVVFGFTWFGLYLARGITGPIEQLAEGTREVAAGNLAYKVQARADDEIGLLVDSFNRMTDD